jgi:UTP--glucose-1-phosphate uridylyltransferase
MSGRVHDCGDKLGYLKAIVDYAMRDEQLGEEFEAFLQAKFSKEPLLKAV